MTCMKNLTEDSGGNSFWINEAPRVQLDDQPVLALDSIRNSALPD